MTNNMNDAYLSSIGYNYAIASTLFYSKNKSKIEAEITNLIYLQIDLILKYNSVISTPLEQLNKVKQVFFKDYINEQGQLGTPMIKVDGGYKDVKTISELKGIIMKFNFREKMSIVRNFAARQNECIMYSILIEYNLAKKENTTNAFENKYPMLNIDYLDDSIHLIENILGFDIDETSNCYAKNDLQGLNEQPCTRTSKPYYQMVQDDYYNDDDDVSTANNGVKSTKSPITLCWLWHPLVYGVPYQDVIKLQADNPVKKISTSFTRTTNKDEITTCMNKIYSENPIFPPLSEREQRYITSKRKQLLKNNDGLYTTPPWSPPICYMKPIEPFSYYVNLQKKYKKYFVSNLSGHTMLFIIMSRYFKNPETNAPINLDYIVLANVLFMVPYNHSIHEVFQAAKLMGINTNYSIKNADLKNMNNFLEASNLNTIILPGQASYIQPKTTKRVPIIPTRGGTKRRNGNKNTKKRKHTYRRKISGSTRKNRNI